MRNGYTSITRLPEKSNEYGLMHVMAVKMIKKNSYSLYFELKKKKKKSHKTLNSVYFWYQLYVLEHLCC